MSCARQFGNMSPTPPIYCSKAFLGKIPPRKRKSQRATTGTNKPNQRPRTYPLKSVPSAPDNDHTQTHTTTFVRHSPDKTQTTRENCGATDLNRRMHRLKRKYELVRAKIKTKNQRRIKQRQSWEQLGEMKGRGRPQLFLIIWRAFREIKTRQLDTYNPINTECCCPSLRTVSSPQCLIYKSVVKFRFRQSGDLPIDTPLRSGALCSGPMDKINPLDIFRKKRRSKTVVGRSVHKAI